MKFFIINILLIISIIDIFSQNSDTSKILNQVEIRAIKSNDFGRKNLNGVENGAIYEGKKTELIQLSKLTVNLATNNARQVFAKIPGLNIWESDGAGLQLGIGARGLSPNRTANFNTRQNGYDIAADPLGYPESYYTPPMEALDRIEVIRGAASLQYGTQFGGMLNFVFLQPDTSQRWNVHTRQTAGSFGFFGSYNRLKFASKDKRTAGVFIYQHRQGNGWRPNSKFGLDMAYLDLHRHVTERLEIGFEYTILKYLAQQAGGLTDAQFRQNPRQSLRARNWFSILWNLPSLSLDYNFDNGATWKTRLFGLSSNRQALGNLERINVVDFGGKRNLIRGDFKNYGAETRFLQHFFTKKDLKNTLLVGARWFEGNTRAQQGLGADGGDANFRFLRQDERLEDSDFDFHNQNFAAFSEYIFRLSPKLSLTPGIRFEYIKTASSGYYRQTTKDLAGNVVSDKIFDNNDTERTRRLLLMGIGLSWKPTYFMEMYANVSQNYRAINFTDLRINNPSLAVNPNIKDERGFTADWGIRGDWRNRINYDISAFGILYRDRIGQVLKADRPPLFLDYRYRTNIADAYYTGIEAYIEMDIYNLNKMYKSPHRLLWFVNGTILKARYFNTDDLSIKGKKVEMAPPYSLRSGLTYGYKNLLKASLSAHFVGEHFTDATNARQATGAVNGIVPSYTVADFSVSYNFFRTYTIEFSCNNIFNQMYFTRRAEAYPGPGIIPSDGRAFFVGLDIKF
jgi:Fe(3+) dicitrate transport protein